MPRHMFTAPATLPDDPLTLQLILRAALAGGAGVVSVTPRRESLEDLFVREAARSVSRDLGAIPW